MVKIVGISDTHGYHRGIKVPKGDILIHTGDITMYGELDILQDFNKWLGELPHAVKIVIAGNHDITLETKPKIAEKILTNCIYLKNSGVEIMGLKFWGSPYTPNMYPIYEEFGFTSRFVFGKNRGQGMERIWKEIPGNLDFLLTHGPPKLILDQTVNMDNAGCEVLAGHCILKKPRYHMFGHIHEAYGISKKRETMYINCSVLDENYDIKNKPVKIEI